MTDCVQIKALHQSPPSSQIPFDYDTNLLINDPFLTLSHSIHLSNYHSSSSTSTNLPLSLKFQYHSFYPSPFLLHIPITQHTYLPLTGYL